MAIGTTPGAPARGRQRRALARTLVLPAALLVIAGALLARRGDSLGALGFLALMQGVGLVVAIVPLALGRNPLSGE